MDKTDLKLSLKEVAFQCGIQKPVNTHNFRRSVITHLVKKGFTVAQVKEITGHSFGSTIEKFYIHYNKKDKKNLFKEAFSEGSPTPPQPEKPKPEPKPEVKPKEPTDTYIAKNNTTEIELKRLELELKESRIAKS